MGPQKKHKHQLEHYTPTSPQMTTTAGQQPHNFQGHTHQPQRQVHQNKQFINTIPHKTNTTNRKITRKVHRLQPTQINITTEQVQAAIKTIGKNNNSTGPDNIKHLKNIGKNRLTIPHNAAINDNKISHVWKLANIIQIPKPNKGHQHWDVIQADIPSIGNSKNT